MLADKLRMSTQQGPQFIATTSAFSLNERVTVDKPTGTVQGDLMVVFLSTADTSPSNETWLTLSGWTKVLDYGTFPNAAIMYKIAGATEPSTYEFKINSPTLSTTARIVTYRKAVYDTISTTSYIASGSTISISAITPSSNSYVIVAAFFGSYTTGIGSSWTTPNNSNLIGLSDGSRYTNAVYSTLSKTSLTSTLDATAALTAVSVSIKYSP